MKGLFVHDFRATKYNGQFYTTNLSYEIWKDRYLYIFDEMEICCRVITAKEDVSSTMVLSSGDHIFFNEKIGSFAGPEILLNSRVYRELKKSIENTDAVIIRVGSLLGTLASRICRKIGKPYLTEVVSCSWDSLWNHGWKGKILAVEGYLCQRCVVKHSTDVVYVTKEFLQRRYPTKGRNTNCSNVALPPIDPNMLEKRLAHIEAHKGKFIIGTIGALDVRYKGQQYVIRALKYLKDQGNDYFEYQLVGGGDDSYLRSQIERYGLQDRVKIIGRMEHTKVFDWLDSIDIYIQPSRQEGLPRSLIEAMSRGLYSIGAATAGIPELLDSRQVFANGSGSYKRIGELLKKINLESLRENAARNIHEAENYSAELIEQRRKAFFDQFIGRQCNETKRF